MVGKVTDHTSTLHTSQTIDYGRLFAYNGILFRAAYRIRGWGGGGGLRFLKSWGVIWNCKHIETGWGGGGGGGGG